MPKRIFKLFCCVLVSLSLFACSSSFKVTDGSFWGIKPSVKNETLTLFLPRGNSQYPIRYDHTLKKVVLKELEKAAKQKFNINLKIGNLSTYVYRTGGGFAYVNIDGPNAIKKGKTCDIFFSQITDQSLLKSLSEQETARDLTDLFPRYAPEYSKLFKKEELDSISYKGKLLGIPSRTLPVSKRLCAIVRDDMAEKYLDEDIKDYDDFTKFMGAVKRSEFKFVPVYFSDSIFRLFGESYGYWAFSPQPAAGMGLVYKRDDPTFKLLSWEQTPEYLQAVNRLKLWRTAGYYAEYGDVSEYEILSGRYASFIGEFGTADKYNKLLEDNDIKSFKYKEYDLYPGTISQRFFEPGNVAFISPKSKHPDRAVMFIEWLMTNQKCYDLFRFGVEDTDYKINENGTIKIIPPEGNSIEEAFFSSQGPWTIYNVAMDHLKKDYFGKKSKYIEQTTAYNGTAGFKMDETTWNDMIKVAGANVYNENYDIKIINGEVTDIDVKNYIDTLKAPMDKFIGQVQPLLNTWLAENRKSNSK